MLKCKCMNKNVCKSVDNLYCLVSLSGAAEVEQEVKTDGGWNKWEQREVAGTLLV